MRRPCRWERSGHVRQPDARRAGVGVVLVILLGGGLASGQDAETTVTRSGVVDTVHVSWQADRVSGVAGSGGSIDLVRAPDGGAAYRFGGAAYGVGDSRWGYGRLDVVVRPTSRLFVGGGTRVGRGTENGSGFRYLSLHALLGYRLHRRVTLTADDEYLDVAAIRGQLVKLGGQVLVSPRVSASASYATSWGGTLDTRFVQGRLDIDRGPFRVFGGGASGRSTPGVIDIGLGLGSRAQRLRQGFVGAVIPVRVSRLTLIVDRLVLDQVSRLTFTVTFGIPV